MEKKKIIEFRNIVKNFDGQIVLKGINLDIYENEFVTLLGPSGCGKTTLLRILGGFLDADEGSVMFDGEEISQKPPYERELNTVFQKYALFPHLNVFNNIAFGLKLKKLPAVVIEKKVKQALKMVGMTDYEYRDVDSLSGGQQQRVAIARAIVNEPEVLLLDEPLAALDLKLRKDMQIELKRIQQQVGITFIYVTHDQEEALTLSDRIAVFNKGVIEQIGHPDEIYSHSATEFVCNFIGDINRLTPEFLAGTGADKVEGVDPKKHCYIRLERMHVNETMATDTLKTEAVVEDYEFYGLYIKYTVRAFGQTIKVIEKNSGKTLYKKGDTVTLSYSPADIMQYEG